MSEEMSEETGAEDVNDDVDTSAEESASNDVDNAENEEAKESTDSDAEKGKADDEGESEDSTGEYTADDFELPEGMEVDEAAMGEFLEIANDKDLSPKERDQALVDLYAKKAQEAADAQVQSWDKQIDEWQEACMKDKEFGGKAYEENKGVMLKALSEYGTKELNEFLSNYGVSEHPDFQRFLFKVGKTLSEDNSAKGSQSDQTSIEERWYGNSNA